MDSAAVWDLLDRLEPASEDSESYHHDLCGGHPGEPCSCGAPALFRDAAQFVRSLAVESAVTQAQRAA